MENMTFLITALVLMMSGVCRCFDEEEFMKKNNYTKCYSCLSDPLDRANATCKTDMTGVPHCHGTECNVLKVELFGDDLIYRICDGKRYTRDLSRTIFSTETGRAQGFGMKVSWSTCHENLCNSYDIQHKAADFLATGSSTVWRSQALTLLASVVLPLKYSTYFY